MDKVEIELVELTAGYAMLRFFVNGDEFPSPVTLSVGEVFTLEVDDEQEEAP